MVDHLTHEHPLPLEQDIEDLAHAIAEFSLSRLVTAAHCLYTANFFFSSPTLKLASGDITWFASFVLCFLQGYGGGVLNSFFYGPINPPFFSDSIVITALLAWFLIFRIPAVRAIFNFFPIKVVFYILEGIHAVKAVTRTVDVVVLNTPDLYFAPIILATIAGAGGSLWIIADQRLRGIETNITIEHNLKICSAVATFYYCSAYIFELCAKDIARLLMTLFYCGNLLISITYGPINVFRISDFFFNKVTGLNNKHLASSDSKKNK